MNYESLHLEEGENVILEVRKHWIVFLGISIAFISAALLPLIIFVLIGVFAPAFFNLNLPGNDVALYTFFYIIWVLTLLIIFFVDWTKYYLDVWYVTEKRIIVVEQRKMFDREISNVRFDKIQDITVYVEGFISTMLDFGNIRVQTASEDNREFFVKMVRHPENVRRVIFGRQNVVNDNFK